MLFDNLVSCVLEAIEFMFWGLPKLFKLLAYILTPFTALAIIGFLAITRGWGQVFETLKAKWVDRASEKNWLSHHNLETGTMIIGAVAEVTMVLGIVFNIALVFMAIFTVGWLVNLNMVP
jgi:hypothetical protein